MAAKSVGALKADANFVADAVLKVAIKSKNLTGTYVKELKLAANMTRNIVDELGRRVTLTGDVSYFEAENTRLRVEMEGLRSEIRTLKALVETKERWDATLTPSQPVPAGEAGVSTPLPSAPVPPLGGTSMETTEGSVSTSRRKRIRPVALCSLDSDDASPPAKVAGGGVKGLPPRPLAESSGGGADPLLEGIGALVERKIAEGLSAFRSELGLVGPTGPRVIGDVTLPPGSIRMGRAAGPAAPKDGAAGAAVLPERSGIGKAAPSDKKREEPPRPQRAAAGRGGEG